MKLFTFMVAMSVVFVFDASAAPLMRVPLPLLVALYLGSMGELAGLAKIVSGVRRRRR